MRQTPEQRAISRAQDIRIALGGSGSLLDPFPPRPTGMHRKTYARFGSHGNARGAGQWVCIALARRGQSFVEGAAIRLANRTEYGFGLGNETTSLMSANCTSGATKATYAIKVLSETWAAAQENAQRARLQPCSQDQDGERQLALPMCCAAKSLRCEVPRGSMQRCEASSDIRSLIALSNFLSPHVPREYPEFALDGAPSPKDPPF